ncbi:prepilin-type N-terminal cleavage/methylation domain-containing protein [Alkalihalobacillus sp. BA299]|uniref:prepilin-type N-terminal cleavage/methylation domain-containing protein n=1 Tax=Alkalihalobacillus sp. BA299 TaxID=2815938 RepID=UPI001FFE05B0
MTLIELLVVIIIIGILASIAIPVVVGVIEKSKDEVCRINILQFEKEYVKHLTIESVDHSDVFFAQFLESYNYDLCDEDCNLTYIDGIVLCSDSSGDDGDTEKDEGVPFL